MQTIGRRGVRNVLTTVNWCDLPLISLPTRDESRKTIISFNLATQLWSLSKERKKKKGKFVYYMPVSWKLSKFSVFGTCPDYSGGAECYHQKYCQRTITLLLEVMSLGRCRRDRRKWCGRDPGQTHSLSLPYPSVTVPVGEPAGDGGCG